MTNANSVIAAFNCELFEVWDLVESISSLHQFDRDLAFCKKGFVVDFEKITLKTLPKFNIHRLGFRIFKMVSGLTNSVVSPTSIGLLPMATIRLEID